MRLMQFKNLENDNKHDNNVERNHLQKRFEENVGGNEGWSLMVLDEVGHPQSGPFRAPAYH